MNAETRYRVRIQAAALKRLGLGCGDRIALLCPDTAEFPCAHHAVLAAGAAVVPVSPLLTVGETMRVLVDSRVDLLLCHSDVVTVGAEAARMAGVRMFTIGPPTRAPGADGRLEDLAEAMMVRRRRAPARQRTKRHRPIGTPW
ncbi:AMP-binding protein [Streptosporangium fragile]